MTPMRRIAKLFLTLTMGMSAITLNAQTMKTNQLSARQQHLITVAAFEAKGDLEHLKQALNAALDDKVSVNELKETLSHLYAYTGFPRSLNGLGTLQMVLDERREAGKADIKGKEATPVTANFDALKEGTRVQTQLTGGRGFNYTFAPATDYYLKAHLFGDIFARDVLTFADRELVTIGALASVKGIEPQLKSHMTGCQNMGVTTDDLQALTEVLQQNVGDIEGYRSRKALAEITGKTFSEGQPVENQIFPKGNPNTAYAKYFIGNSYLASLNEGGDFPLHNVTFEPRCRNNWHVHHKGGQVLVCVGGEGWYQAWGEPARKLHPGDVVNIPAEVKHWHGATADSWFQHIAIEVPAEGRSNEWLEPVTDEEYNKLK